MFSSLLKNTLIILFLIIIVAGVSLFSAPTKAMLFSYIPGGSVKGASTDKAQEISKSISKDINSQIDETKKQALNIKVSDVINGFSRLQKIPHDVKFAEEFIKDQVDNVLKSKK